ncbi:hypothetical protein BDP27DRAFT_1354098 [Rhodocollybia butyracea]|uniref:Uncharacterized protein n=1 Tax=Rhodocollybia butyracea TaxID=206335 RepID=A0A9P5P4C1_9AGAR|nr:hypothetical protein BDP27DRAFT_1354098 [Rhodocollybia butyracea]
MSGLEFSSSSSSTVELEKYDGYDRAVVTITQPQLLTSRKFHPTLDPMRLTCVISHVGLIILLASLALKRPERGSPGVIFFDRPSFQINNEIDSMAGQMLQSGFKYGYGWIVIGWTVLLTLTAQRLALRRQLNLHSSLTAKHDANGAWMSVGSAILTALNWRQLGFRASLNSIFVPLVYLSAIASFHSVATGMFGLVIKQFNTALSFSSFGIPDFTGLDAGNALTGGSTLLTLLSLNTLEFPGLTDSGLIYDIPNPNDISILPDGVLVTVGATNFNVTCGSISGSFKESSDGLEFAFPPSFGLEDPLILGLPGIISQQSLLIRPAPWGSLADDQSGPLALWPSSIVIFTTLPVSDSFGNHASEVPLGLNPPMTYRLFNSTLTETTSSISVLACNLTLDEVSNKATIDPLSNSLLNLTGQVNTTSAALSPFPVVSRSTLLDLSNATDALIDIWSLLPISAVSPMNEQLQNFCTGNGNSLSDCGTLYEPEQFVMESMNIFPDFLLPPNSASVSSIDLVDLENVLSRMTAIAIWSEGQGNGFKFENGLITGVGLSSDKSFVTHENTVLFQQPFLVFAINRLELFIAIAIAILLLALVTPSLFDNNSLKIDSIGILQMIWLANDHPEIQESITKLKDPSIDELRKEGLLIKRNFHRYRGDLPQQPC